MRTLRMSALSLALAAHDPDRTLARGYALVTDPAGEPVTAAAQARAARDVGLRFSDGSVAARVQDGDGEEPAP